ncbi:hypothetical protein O988_06610 [Pseudogymnoascus sp. VKM F-3808]|nr:hypothetical protein O988_06610 [Pseudogymnoascus sp. VKM F-3808]
MSLQNHTAGIAQTASEGQYFKGFLRRTFVQAKPLVEWPSPPYTSTVPPSPQANPIRIGTGTAPCRRQPVVAHALKLYPAETAIYILGHSDDLVP